MMEELFDLWTMDLEERSLQDLLASTVRLVPTIVFSNGSFCIKARLVLDSSKGDVEEYWSKGPVPGLGATKISAFIPSQTQSRWCEQSHSSGGSKTKEPQLPAIGRLELYYNLDSELTPPQEHVESLQKLATRLGRVIAHRKKVQDLKEELANTKVAERRLKKSLGLAKVGQWDLDLVTNKLVWSPEIFKLFKINPKRFGASYEAFLNAIHPEDREFVNEAYTNSLVTKQPYNVVHRLLFPDGSVKWVKEVCRTEFHPVTGKPLYSIGTVQEIALEDITGACRRDGVIAPSTSEIRWSESPSTSDSRSCLTLNTHEEEEEEDEEVALTIGRCSHNDADQSVCKSNHRQPKRSESPPPPASEDDDDESCCHCISQAPLCEVAFVTPKNGPRRTRKGPVSPASTHTSKTFLDESESTEYSSRGTSTI